MDKISVIIPVYNIACYLHRCLDSVIMQSYQDLEIIVVNDGSSDNSLDVLKEYASKDCRVKIIDKVNGGVTSCRQAGMDQAEGTYIFFLDGDDWLELETLERLYFSAKIFDADITLGNVYFSNDTTCDPLPSIGFETLSSTEFIHQLATGKQLWSLCMKLIKTSLCRRMVIPDGLSMAEDMTGMFQLAFYARIVAKSNYYGYHYYQRMNAATKTPTLKHAGDALIAAQYITTFFERECCSLEYTADVALINLRCLLTSCNQGGISAKDPLVRKIYTRYYEKSYLSLFSWPHRLILYGFKRGVNLYKLFFAYRRLRYHFMKK